MYHFILVHARRHTHKRARAVYTDYISFRVKMKFLFCACDVCDSCVFVWYDIFGSVLFFHCFQIHFRTFIDMYGDPWLFDLNSGLKSTARMICKTTANRRKHNKCTERNVWLTVQMTMEWAEAIIVSHVEHAACCINHHSCHVRRALDYSWLFSIARHIYDDQKIDVCITFKYYYEILALNTYNSLEIL